MEQIFKQLGYIRKINEKAFRDRGSGFIARF